MLSGVERWRWRCSLCDRVWRPREITYACPECGDNGLLDGEPDLTFAREAFDPDEAPLSVRRYADLLPLPRGAFDRVRPDVGGTPLIDAPGLANLSGAASVAIKDEGRNPSGSLKDRASIVVAAQAVALGARTVVTSSSGNAAVALAACVAGTGVECVVFVPATIPAGKRAQLVAYGARIVLAQGGYEQAVAASRMAADRLGWLCRNTAFNPFTTQGKKTMALEVAEQCAGRPVDAVLIPTGDGNILSATHAGFREAVAMGWLRRVPRLFAVQARHADAIHNAWVEGLEEPIARRATSCADSINVAQPADGRRALSAVRSTGGGVLLVDEIELADAARVIGAQAGVFSEPAAATGWPALLQARRAGLVRSDEHVVIVSTGTGLKDPSYVDTVKRNTEVIGASQELALAEQVEALAGRATDLD